MLGEGGDPRAHRERKRQAKALEDARSVTFEAAARNYHERHKPNWRSDRYARQWLRSLELHAFPVIGNLGVGAVDLPAVKKVLEPIWYDKPRVAQVVRANVESVLNFAYAEGHRTATTPLGGICSSTPCLPARALAREVISAPSPTPTCRRCSRL